MEMVDRKRQPPVKSLPSRAGREFKKFTHRSGIVVTVLFKGEKGFFLGTPSKGKTKARGPSSCPRARSMNPMVSKMPGASRGRGRGDRSAASEGGYVRGSPCGECARLRSGLQGSVAEEAVHREGRCAASGEAPDRSVHAAVRLGRATKPERMQRSSNA